jgi:hypothetical protein
MFKYAEGGGLVCDSFRTRSSQRRRWDPDGSCLSERIPEYLQPASHCEDPNLRADMFLIRVLVLIYSSLRSVCWCWCIPISDPGIGADIFPSLIRLLVLIYFRFWSGCWCWYSRLWSWCWCWYITVSDLGVSADIFPSLFRVLVLIFPSLIWLLVLIFSHCNERISIS